MNFKSKMQTLTQDFVSVQKKHIAGKIHFETIFKVLLEKVTSNIQLNLHYFKDTL